MNASPPCDTARFELRFDSLFRSGRGYSFDCDAGGRVDIDGLSSRIQASYHRARSLVGHEFGPPRVVSLVERTSPLEA
jgi:hypothetical protein